MISKAKKYIDDHGGLFVHGSVDILFFIFLVVIVAVGLLMLYSSSYPYAYYYDGDSSLYFRKQLIFTVVGFGFMIFFSKLNYKIFIDLGAHIGTAVSILLLIIARFMPEYHGTHRWISIGGFHFQPSDIAKFALILTLAMWLDKYNYVVTSKNPCRGKFAKRINAAAGKPIINDSIKIILICGFVIAVYAGLVAIGSHLSGTILMLLIGIVMLYLGEVRGKWFIIGGIFVVIVFLIAYESGIIKGYMEERVVAWLDKDYDPTGVRWQTNQALYAIGSGGFFGKGLGNSTQKYLYVSEPQNDMIFSIVVEELGFFGSSLIILLFALLVWRGVVIGIFAETRYGALVAMGISFQLAIQVVLNILVATDSIPNTGIALPFFSYGGTAMLMNLSEMGFVLSISRSSRIKRR